MKYPVSTKAMVIYYIMPKKIIPFTPELRSRHFAKSKNANELINFEDSKKMGLATFYYKLPSKGIALEEFLDYLVVNIGDKASEKLFPKVMEIATMKEKGLILKPPNNPKHLYLMDKIVIQHNELNDFESILF